MRSRSGPATVSGEMGFVGEAFEPPATEREFGKAAKSIVRAASQETWPGAMKTHRLFEEGAGFMDDTGFS